MNKVQKSLTNLLNKSSFGRLILAYYLLQKNYLSPSGWTKSVLSKQPVNRSKDPIPWFTYSFISFISTRLKSNFKIFEFGSGNSTIWLSSFGCEVTSVEHDEHWHNILKPKFQKIKNIKSSLQSLESKSYAQSVLRYKGHFDIIIIDGRDRIQCCKNSLQALKSNGVIIWDNSDRLKYAKGYEFLKKNGFKRLDFKGFGPINSREWSTTVFYRENNCLKI